jgi:hypothetical protein
VFSLSFFTLDFTDELMSLRPPLVKFCSRCRVASERLGCFPGDLMLDLSVFSRLLLGDDRGGGLIFLREDSSLADSDRDEDMGAELSAFSCLVSFLTRGVPAGAELSLLSGGEGEGFWGTSLGHVLDLVVSLDVLVCPTWGIVLD